MGIKFSKRKSTAGNARYSKPVEPFLVLKVSYWQLITSHPSVFDALWACSKFEKPIIRCYGAPIHVLGENIRSGVSQYYIKCQACRSLQTLKIITKTRLFKYIENFTSKNWKFSDKKNWYFSYFCSKHICGYSLEPPRRGGSNVYHNLCFWAEIRKIMYTPVNPSFTL